MTTQPDTNQAAAERPLTADHEAEIRAREAAATPGPWTLHDDWPGRVFSNDIHRGHIARVTGNGPEANERFIAHARVDVPALLAEVDRLRAERDQFADRVDTLTAVAQSNKRHVHAMYAELQEAQRERDALQQRLDAVLALCDREQRNATRWEQPLPVPEWVAAVRNAAAPASAEDGDRRA